MGFEPMTPCLQGRCSPSWATPPDFSWDFAVSPFFIFAKQKFHPLADFIHLWISFSLCENFIAILWIALVGPSGLEPPTSCLSGTRSNLLSYEPMWLVKWFSFHLVLQCREQIALLSHCVGIELSSRAASSQVLSPLQSLTSVFGMGTGGPSAFVTPTILSNPLITEYWTTLILRTVLRLTKSFEPTR